MTRPRTERGYSIVDVLVGLVLLALVILSIYQLYLPTFRLSQNIHEGLETQQDVRLAIDRVARALHETSTAFGRVRLYGAESGCTGAYEGCIGFVTARDAQCAGAFQLVGGAPDWQATMYVWRDTASNELRLRCDASSTFPVSTWPPTLDPYSVIGTKVVSASFTLQPVESPVPTAIAVALQEQAATASPQTSRYHTKTFNQTVFLPQNR
jgi:type II secretory pathway component PulJ